MSLPLLERLHGHVAVLAVALLFHPAILLWRGQPLSRGGTWAVALSVLVTLTAFVLGLVIYPDYRELVRHDLTLASPTAALLFETKEHLAWGALSGGLGAGTAALVAPRSASTIRRLAARAFLCAALTGLVVGGLGIHIASVHTFR
jgi:hypothetical protein